MSEAASAVPRLLRKLLADAVDPAAEDAALAECVSILQRPMSGAVVPDESVVADRIMKHLLRTTSSTEKALQFRTLHTKLKTLGHLDRRWTVLQFLLSLSEMSEDTSPPPNMQALQNGLAALGLGNHPDATPLEYPSRGEEPAQGAAPGRGRPSDGTARQAAARRAVKEPPALPDRSYGSVREGTLLRDMVYMFQGIEGKVVKQTENGRIYFEEPLPGPVRMIILRLYELGRSYQDVVDFLAGDVREAGVMRQAFCSTLNRELTEYYRLIAVLEAQMPFPDPSVPDQAGDLTLKRLLVWTQEPLERMKMMSTLTKACKDDKGGALLSKLHTYADHGDPALQRFIQKLLTEVSRPFQDMLRRWIFEGELEDPAEEFFIALGAEENVDMWRDKFVIRQEMKPDFIGQDLAQKILNIGKSLNFLRYSCKETDFILSQSRQSFQDDLDFSQMTDFETLIDASYLVTNRHLMDSLFDRHKLLMHLEAMKRYFFMAQGDFVQHLLESSSQLLDQNSTELRKQMHHLTGMFDAAIRSANTGGSEPDAARRLDVMLLQSNDGDNGWKSLSLKYQVEPPISTIINKAALGSYQKIFNFLLQLKGVSHRLTEAWSEHASYLKSYWKRKDFAKERHRASVTLSEMIHFVGQLQYYLMFEALENSWTLLMERLARRGPDLDAVVDAHEAYLASILVKSMLVIPDIKGESRYHKQLQSIFSEMIAFRHTHSRLARWMETEMNQGDADGGSGPSSHELIDIQAALENHKKRFQVDACELLGLLRTAKDDSLRALGDRLNFNDVYRVTAIPLD
ncbi:Spc98 family-domain-containing protein [Hyaloraphidium curvatum]|nr:Spc98 family-domain-containing protein [Hyaloraphidium curvatum]